jgi:hypothetical protein
MPNGARHILGAAIGLILTPVITAGLMLGTERLLRGFQTFRFTETDYRLGGLILAGVGLLLGLIVGSRMSPLTSLIPGLTFTAVGVLWVVAPRWIAEKTNNLPGTLENGYRYVGPYGIFLLLGVLLLVASLFPSRWAARDRQPAGSSYEYETANRPYSQSPSAGQPQQQPPGPGQRPAPYLPGSGAAPEYSAPSGSGHQLPSSGTEHEGGAGGWTQMYGSGGRS